MTPLIIALPTAATPSIPVLAWLPMAFTALVVVASLVWSDVIRDLPKWVPLSGIGFIPLGAVLALLAIPALTERNPRLAVIFGLALTIAGGMQAYVFASVWRALTG